MARCIGRKDGVRVYVFVCHEKNNCTYMVQEVFPRVPRLFGVFVCVSLRVLRRFQHGLRPPKPKAWERKHVLLIFDTRNRERRRGIRNRRDQAQPDFLLRGQISSPSLLQNLVCATPCSFFLNFVLKSQPDFLTLVSSFLVIGRVLL